MTMNDVQSKITLHASIGGDDIYLKCSLVNNDDKTRPLPPIPFHTTKKIPLEVGTTTYSLSFTFLFWAVLHYQVHYVYISPHVDDHAHPPQWYNY